MIPQNRKYILIIVHYGNSVVTDRLLKVILSSENRPDRVVVIDNAKEKYQAPVSDVELNIFRASRNDGYAAGINIGLGSLLNSGIDKHDIVICMNNDAVVDEDLIKSVKKWWQDNPSPVLMGLKKGAVNLFSGRAVIDSSSAFYKLRYLHGSFLAAPYGVWASLTGWPDKYFLYWEDVLLSRQAKIKKIPLKVSHITSYKHDDAIREKYSDDQTYYLVRNGALFLEKETTFFWRMWWWLINRLRLIWHKYFNRQANKVVVKALNDAIKGVTGKRKV